MASERAVAFMHDAERKVGVGERWREKEKGAEQRKERLATA